MIEKTVKKLMGQNITICAHKTTTVENIQVLYYLNIIVHLGFLQLREPIHIGEICVTSKIAPENQRIWFAISSDMALGS